MAIIEGLEKATGKKIDPSQTELKTPGSIISPGIVGLRLTVKTYGPR
jgi:hypothetical protein